MNLKRGCGQSFWTDGESRQTNSDAREKHRISENFDAEKIDEHCRMTKPRDRDRCVAPLFGFRLGRDRNNRPPAFNRPFTEKMTKPVPYPRTAQSWSFRWLHAKGIRPRSSGVSRPRALVRAC